MSGNQAVTGACLCGKVRISVEKMNPHFEACHCATCRRWGGGPLLAIDCYREVSFSAPDLVTRFASSDWAERGFCSCCGTHLFYYLKPAGKYLMPVGLFDFTEQPAFHQQIFIDEKPGYYNFAEATETLTGAEVAALFAGQGLE